MEPGRVGETDVRMAPGARLQVLGTKWDVSGTLYCEGFLWSVCWPQAKPGAHLADPGGLPGAAVEPQAGGGRMS